MNYYIILDENNMPLSFVKHSGFMTLLTSTSGATLFPDRKSVNKAIRLTKKFSKAWNWHIDEWRVIRCKVQS